MSLIMWLMLILVAALCHSQFSLAFQQCSKDDRTDSTQNDCNSQMSRAPFKHIPSARLGVSEPNPRMFGNGPNQNLPTWTNANWLKSRFHFSFAEYFNPHNQNFGVLRVMNDDLVQPSRGFGTHPHRDAEICTYVVHGELTHADSMGTRETIGAGSVQFMSAGTGVMHSEHNLNAEKPLRFIQIWITPRARGLRPNYGSFTSTPESRSNKWAHLVGPTPAAAPSNQPAGKDTPIKIEQDANIFVTELSAGSSVDLTIPSGRQAYLLCIDGPAEITGEGHKSTMQSHDAAELGPSTFKVSTATGAHLLMVEMAHALGGRSDF